MMRIRYIICLLAICIAYYEVLVACALAADTVPQRASIVTGASGYIGREVVHCLLQDSSSSNQHKIYCLVRPSRVEDERNYWGRKSDSVSVMPYDMTDGGKTIREALKAAYNTDGEEPGDDSEIDACVYHVASNFGPTEDHAQTAIDNVQGAEDLVNSVAEFKKCRLVLTSSMAAVRGTGQEPQNREFYTHEDWNTLSKLGANWGSSYQWSKAESERRAWELAEEKGIPMTSLCPSFVFGPPSDGIMSGSYSITLVGQWARGESPVQSRLCVDIRDIARAHVAAATNPAAIGQRYIVSKEERVSSKEMADALKRVCRESGLGNAEKITFDSEFSGGAIPIGNKEVESLDRLKELGVSLRSVDET